MFRYKPKSTDKLGVVERDAFQSYLVDLRNHFGDYHARKENVAWVALVLFVGSAGGLLSVIGSSAAIRLWLATGITWVVLLVAFVLLTVMVVLFMYAQFSARHVAADIIEACGDLLSVLAYLNSVFRYRHLETIVGKHPAYQT